MRFSLHFRHPTWFGFGCRQEVCGIFPIPVGINMVGRCLHRAMPQVLDTFGVLTGGHSAVNEAASSRVGGRTSPLNMKNNRIFIFTLLAILLALSIPKPAFAGQPLLPAAFYGNVTADNQTTLHAGLVVVAAIDGIEYARGNVFSTEGAWVYTLKVPADDPSTEAVDGGRPGDRVTFSIDGEILGTAPWQGGSNTPVDLSLTGGVGSASAETPNSPAWLPWLLLALALLLVFAVWFLFIRPRNASPAS